jgi:exoribonuclease R
MDLDQAMHLSRDGEGFLVRYAIADVAAFVDPGGAIDAEAHRRGVTVYGPDRRAPLHPVELSEGAASLLPGEDRPALVWELRLDSSGQLTDTALGRALVRSREKLSYEDVQRDVAAGTAGDMLALLPEIGRLREELERARGGVSLPVPQQEIVVSDDGYGLEYRSPLPVEGWNAQLSLLTGMAGASLMREGRIGILRTLPPARRHDVERLRRTARALRIDWPANLPRSATRRPPCSGVRVTSPSTDRCPTAPATPPSRLSTPT